MLVRGATYHHMCMLSSGGDDSSLAAASAHMLQSDSSASCVTGLVPNKHGRFAAGKMQAAHSQQYQRTR